jgi:hypothetical protein
MNSQISKSKAKDVKKPRSGGEAFTTKSYCPYCHSNSFRRTQRRGFLEKLLSIVNFLPFRCLNYSCNGRFFKFGK